MKADTMPAPGSPNLLWYARPASQWIEALPLGNGRLGAMVFGGATTDRVQINDITLWSGGPQPEANRPEAWKRLPEIREVIRQGRYDEAEKLCNQFLTCQANYDANKYQILGNIDCSFQLPAGEPTAYRRWLNIEKAVAGVEFKIGDVDFRREYFCSAPDRVLVLRFTASRPGNVSVEVKLWRPEKAETRFAAPDQLVMTGATGPNLSFQTNLRVLHRNGKIVGDGDYLQVEGADEVTILVAANTSYIMDYAKKYKGADPADAEKYVNAAAGKSIDRIREEHINDYQQYFQRCSLDLGTTDAAKEPTDERVRKYGDGRNDPALATLLFQFGRYLLISSSRAGSPVPANLQGLWADQLNTPWNGDYTLNINFEMNYWPAELTGLSEMHTPMLRHIGGLVEPGRQTAKAYFGPDTPGWVAAAKSNIWGWTSPGAKLPWGVWFGSNGWLCQHLWERYAFTRDRQYLALAYPIMKGASEFWLSQLVEGTDGQLITSPSSSPENNFRTDTGMRSSVCEGATMERAIVWELLDNTSRAAQILGVDAALRDKLSSARDRIRPLQIGKAGQLMEWGEDWDLNAPDPRHRHVSHLYPLHPGRQIIPGKTPELATASRKTLELRGDDGTGWALAWKINFWARLHDGDHAFKMLATQLRPTSETKVVMSKGGTYPNLFDAHPPFQIDGNFGATSGIAEMLVQSHDSYTDPANPTMDYYYIDLLPALPTAWLKGVVRGLRCRGGFAVDMTWNEGQLVHASILSMSGEKAQLRYRGKTVPLSVSAGKSALVKEADFK